MSPAAGTNPNDGSGGDPLGFLSAEAHAAIERLIGERVQQHLAESVTVTSAAPQSPYMTIPEAADYLRCRRHRIDDLLSAGRIPRVKEGSRTLLRRSDVDRYLNDGGERRTR